MAPEINPEAESGQEGTNKTYSSFSEDIKECRRLHLLLQLISHLNYINPIPMEALHWPPGGLQGAGHLLNLNQGSLKTTQKSPTTWKCGQYCGTVLRTCCSLNSPFAIVI